MIASGHVPEKSRVEQTVTKESDEILLVTEVKNVLELNGNISVLQTPKSRSIESNHWINLDPRPVENPAVIDQLSAVHSPDQLQYIQMYQNQCIQTLVQKSVQVPYFDQRKVSIFNGVVACRPNVGILAIIDHWSQDCIAALHLRSCLDSPQADSTNICTYCMRNLSKLPPQTLGLFPTFPPGLTLCDSRLLELENGGSIDDNNLDRILPI
jgi:hypothetical protein